MQHGLEIRVIKDLPLAGHDLVLPINTLGIVINRPDNTDELFAVQLKSNPRYGILVPEWIIFMPKDHCEAVDKDIKFTASDLATLTKLRILAERRAEQTRINGWKLMNSAKYKRNTSAGRDVRNRTFIDAARHTTEWIDELIADIAKE